MNENGHAAPIDSGGGTVDGSPFLALNPTDPKDQALIRREMTRHPARWRKMDQRRKDYVVSCLDWAMRMGRKYVPSEEGEHPLDGARLVVSAAKTYVQIEGQNQVDEAKAPPTVTVNVNQPQEFRLEFDRSG